MVSWYQVLGARYQVLGTKYQVITWYQVSCLAGLAERDPAAVADGGAHAVYLASIAELFPTP